MLQFLTKSIFKPVSNASGHSANNMKRFYKQSSFKHNDKPAHPLHKYLIQLDSKNMRTPYRNVLAVPTKALALMISNQFNRQDKLLKTIQMPILALSRTAVDADIQGHLAQHLKNTIYQYLKTDTILFFEDKFDEKYKKLVQPLIQLFKKRFNMVIQPSQTLDPPKVQISQQFIDYIDSLSNWQLIGIQTMVIWMKSSICAISIVSIYLSLQNFIATDFDPIQIQKAAYLQQSTQMELFGQVQERIMDINQIKLMISCGQMMYRLSEE